MKILDSNFLNQILENFNIDEVIKIIVDYFAQQFGKSKIESKEFYRFSRRENRFIKLYPTRDNQIPDYICDLLRRCFNSKKVVLQNNHLIFPLKYLDKCIALILLKINPTEEINISSLKKYNDLLNIFSLIYYNVNIYNLAIHDSLTKLYNKRFFDYKSEEIWEESRNKNKNFAIIMIDIDHFKHYNDKYGHPVGDRILRIVSKRINEIVGNLGIVARYGGEEFVILLPEKDKNEGYTIAEKIRKSIENLKIVTKEYFWRLSISAGVASYPDDGEELDEIIKSADNALYHSKRTGRNKVSIYEKFI